MDNALDHIVGLQFAGIIGAFLAIFLCIGDHFYIQYDLLSLAPPRNPFDMFWSVIWLA